MLPSINSTIDSKYNNNNSYDTILSRLRVVPTFNNKFTNIYVNNQNNNNNNNGISSNSYNNNNNNHSNKYNSYNYIKNDYIKKQKHYQYKPKNNSYNNNNNNITGKSAELYRNDYEDDFEEPEPEIKLPKIFIKNTKIDEKKSIDEELSRKSDIVDIENMEIKSIAKDSISTSNNRAIKLQSEFEFAYSDDCGDTALTSYDQNIYYDTKYDPKINENRIYDKNYEHGRVHRADIPEAKIIYKGYSNHYTVNSMLVGNKKAKKIKKVDNEDIKSNKTKTKNSETTSKIKKDELIPEPFAVVTDAHTSTKSNVKVTYNNLKLICNDKKNDVEVSKSDFKTKLKPNNRYFNKQLKLKDNWDSESIDKISDTSYNHSLKNNPPPTRKTESVLNQNNFYVSQTGNQNLNERFKTLFSYKQLMYLKFNTNGSNEFDSYYNTSKMNIMKGVQQTISTTLTQNNIQASNSQFSTKNDNIPRKYTSNNYFYNTGNVLTNSTNNLTNGINVKGRSDYITNSTFALKLPKINANFVDGMSNHDKTVDSKIIEHDLLVTSSGDFQLQHSHIENLSNELNDEINKILKFYPSIHSKRADNLNPTNILKIRTRIGKNRDENVEKLGDKNKPNNEINSSIDKNNSTSHVGNTSSNNNNHTNENLEFSKSISEEESNLKRYDA